jgi:hypothetical protein
MTTITLRKERVTMQQTLSTSLDAGDAVQVIVRAATTDFEEPPEWQRRCNYAMGEDRRGALTDALRPRVQAWALERTLDELLAHPETRGAGDVVVRRDWGAYGYLEVTIIEAAGPLLARYLAVSQLTEKRARRLHRRAHRRRGHGARPGRARADRRARRAARRRR